MPKVSVIIPCYNLGQYLDEAVNSVLNQTFQDFEIIVVNDGSTDEFTNKLLRNYTKPKTKVIITTNQGLSAARNNGIRISSGEYICCLDSDDVYNFDFLKKTVALLEKDTEHSVGFITTWIQVFGDANYIWQCESYHPCKLALDNIVHVASLFRRECWEKNGGYATDLSSYEDWSFWISIIALGYRWECIQEPLFNYRKRQGSMLSEANKRRTILYNQVVEHNKHFYIKNINIILLEAMEQISNKNKQIQEIKHEAISIKEELQTIKNSKSYKIFIAIKFFQKYPYKMMRKIIDKLFYYCIKIIKSSKKFFLPIKNWIETLKIRKGFQKKIQIELNKKNILFIVPWMTVGGADKVNLDLVTYLDKSKYCIQLITTRESLNEWENKFRKITPNIFLLPEMYPEKSQAYYCKCIIEYLKIVKIDRIIVSNSTIGYDCLPIIKQKFPRIKIYDLLHGQGRRKGDGGLPKYSAGYDRWIDKRIVINNYLKNYIINEYGISEQKIKVIYNGTNLNDSTHYGKTQNFYRDQLGFSLNDFIVVYIGRLSDEKHPEIVIEIANEIVNHRGLTNIKFLIAGEGNLKQELSKAIDKYELDSVVFPIGYIDDIPRLLLESDILILTSEMEGLPIVILESMAMGVPVIASKVGGIPEIIADGYDSFLVEYDENIIKNFSEKLVLLTENENLRKQFSLRAQRKIEKQFSIKKMIEQYEQLLG